MGASFSFVRYEIYGTVQGIYVRCLSLAKLLPPSLVSCLAGCFCVVYSIRTKFLIFDVELSVSVCCTCLHTFFFFWWQWNKVEWYLCSCVRAVFRTIWWLFIYEMRYWVRKEWKNIYICCKHIVHGIYHKLIQIRAKRNQNLCSLSSRSLA